MYGEYVIRAHIPCRTPYAIDRDMVGQRRFIVNLTKRNAGDKEP
jgi:hypothetical protein